jgi:hypothetical protein
MSRSPSYPPQTMQTTQTTQIPPVTSGPAPVAVERRNRKRLRDLCDEVLASFRQASGRATISDDERGEARQLLSRIAPMAAPRGD